MRNDTVAVADNGLVEGPDASGGKPDTLIAGLEAVGVDYSALHGNQKKQALNQHLFLLAYAHDGTIARASQMAGITPKIVYLWREADTFPTFRNVECNVVGQDGLARTGLA